MLPIVFRNFLLRRLAQARSFSRQAVFFPTVTVFRGLFGDVSVAHELVPFSGRTIKASVFRARA